MEAAAYGSSGSSVQPWSKRNGQRSPAERRQHTGYGCAYEWPDMQGRQGRRCGGKRKALMPELEWLGSVCLKALSLGRCLATCQHNTLVPELWTQGQGRVGQTSKMGSHANNLCGSSWGTSAIAVCGHWLDVAQRTSTVCADNAHGPQDGRTWCVAMCKCKCKYSSHGQQNLVCSHVQMQIQ